MNHFHSADVPHDMHSAASASAGLLMRVLDEIDYAMLLVTADGALRYANQLALAEVLCEGPLALTGGRIRADLPADQAALHEALADAVHGRRRLITLGRPGLTASVAVLPLPCGEAGTSEPVALLVFGKRRHCEALTIDFFARSNGLTGAESRVLHGLCRGERPKDIAREAGVAISTVRTHVGSIRQKTQTASIGELVHRVTALPPITSAIKPAGRSARPSLAAAPMPVPPLAHIGRTNVTSLAARFVDVALSVAA